MTMIKGSKYKQILRYGPVLQIRRDNRDNLGIIFHISPLKHIFDPSSEPSCGGESNEGSQNMFLLRNKKKYLLIILNNPSYL